MFTKEPRIRINAISDKGRGRGRGCRNALFLSRARVWGRGAGEGCAGRGAGGEGGGRRYGELVPER